MLAAAAAALVQGFAGSARPSHASLGSARSAVSMATPASAADPWPYSTLLAKARPVVRGGLVAV